jgi:hypothetical protein
MYCPRTAVSVTNEFALKTDLRLTAQAVINSG